MMCRLERSPGLLAKVAPRPLCHTSESKQIHDADLAALLAGTKVETMIISRLLAECLTMWGGSKIRTPRDLLRIIMSGTVPPVRVNRYLYTRHCMENSSKFFGSEDETLVCFTNIETLRHVTSQLMMYSRLNYRQK